MSIVNLHTLKIGNKFFVSQYLIDQSERHQLLEIGMIPSALLEVVHKSFSFIIIKCNGYKFAISDGIAKKLLVSQVIM